ncbi:sugar ABC transporter ATP-binding protein [Burkholderia ubonensis]|uniref:ABC transporter ATP-binding protein n=1 Tax=Burkholderia ubonensis TaxID=101571 RepID=UPI00075A7859|nr:sn-glycerol-3-phosphate ABC transporter ATP-binding protein UgpC [Burkholderia ubonensis]KVD30157.1 sugar ABC transporter ATP-binding protein [Burkholderia ubonensis]KVT84420.1 sugar ABC transporter ATP-binding protein [Burkholderia ubonensis]
MTRLTIENVRKRYGDIDILKGINLTIESGQFLILVGASGCGKSTLLNMIAGLEPIEDGQISIDSRVVNHTDPKDRDIAMVFQSYALYPGMSVRENIEFAMEMRGMRKAERSSVVDRVSAMLQIEHLLDRKPAQLSGGQRQRVAMGRALARNPKVFLFDEPLSNLDAKLRVEMRSEIKKFHQRLRTTTVYVTHDQVEAMTLGDRVAVMKDGVVQQFGTPDDIYTQPANLYVATFIGAPTMNLMKARLASVDGRWLARFGDDGGAPGIDLGPVGDPSRDGHHVIVGVRPEQFVLDLPSGMPALRGAVRMIEPTGCDTYLEIETAAGPVTVRVPPRSSWAPGDHVALGIDPDTVCVFDPASERRIEI